MTAEGGCELAEDRKPAGNDSFSWSQFDPEAYFQHYYGEPHVDDDLVVRHACAALLAARPEGNRLETIDIGTGPNLFPLFCAAPRAASLTAWEFSASNVDWLKAEIASDTLRPQWAHFWEVVRESYPPAFDLPANPLPLLRGKVHIRQGSVYDLPARQWDAATMFFCAESITEKVSEFEAACVRFAGCVRPGGSLAAAFLAGSSGYPAGERRFPALNLSEADIRAVFAPLTTELHTEQIGVVEEEVRSGYSGMVFLTARAA